jgi:hypothetical protein
MPCYVPSPVKEFGGIRSKLVHNRAQLGRREDKAHIFAYPPITTGAANRP